MKYKKIINDLEVGDIIIQSKSQLKYIEKIFRYDDNSPQIIIRFFVLNFSNPKKPLYIQTICNKNDKLNRVQWEVLSSKQI